MLGLFGNLSAISMLASQTSLAGRRLCQNVKEYQKGGKTVETLPILLSKIKKKITANGFFLVIFAPNA